MDHSLTLALWAVALIVFGWALGWMFKADPKPASNPCMCDQLRDRLDQADNRKREKHRTIADQIDNPTGL